jgi:ABC-type Fe3+-hydroxamate transport system substrate-binding protein
VKSFLWFVLGTTAGFVLAHAVDKDPRGHELLAEIDSRINEFTDRVGDAYRDQQTRLNELVADVTDAAANAAKISD